MFLTFQKGDNTQCTHICALQSVTPSHTHMWWAPPQVSTYVFLPQSEDGLPHLYFFMHTVLLICIIYPNKYSFVCLFTCLMCYFALQGLGLGLFSSAPYSQHSSQQLAHAIQYLLNKGVNEQTSFWHYIQPRIFQNSIHYLNCVKLFALCLLLRKQTFIYWRWIFIFLDR